MSGLDWRAMRPTDLDDVVRIAAIGFPDHREDQACFESRLAVYPEGCFVLADTGSVDGYLVAYPWALDTAPVLNSRIETLPANASVLYLHDLALHPDTRGRGWSRPAMQTVCDLARTGGLTTVALVAVNDAVRFWQGHGFQVRQTAGMETKLASYGPDARYMTRAA